MKLHCLGKKLFPDSIRYVFVNVETGLDGGGTVEVPSPPIETEDPYPALYKEAEVTVGAGARALNSIAETGSIPNVTEANFQQEVLNAPGLIVVDFYADWCEPCRIMGGIMESAMNGLPDGVQIKKLDTEANRNIANQYNIEGIPAMVFFRGGQEVTRYTGVQEREEFLVNVERISRESPEITMLRTRLDSARSRADNLNINTRALLADIERDTENATEAGKRVLTQTACMRLEAAVQSETDACRIFVEKSRNLDSISPGFMDMIETMPVPDHPLVLAAIADRFALPNPINAKWSDILATINALPEGTTEQTLFERRFQNLLQTAGNFGIDISTYQTRQGSREDRGRLYDDLQDKLSGEILAAGRVLTRDMDYFMNEIGSG